jgi:putative tryptophan/tyrosine transport system substrate-binding protein
MEGCLMKNNGWVLLALIPGALLPVCLANAQTATIPRIGIVRAGSPPDALLEAFLQGLRDLGYVDGKNIKFDVRFAGGKPARAPDLVMDLLREKVDAIFTATTPAIKAFKQTNTTIPLVMVSTTDPVRSGLVASLAQPGGNITGVSLMATDLWPKRLELLKDVAPKASKVAIFWNKSNAGMAIEAKATQEAAGPLGIALQDRGVNDPDEIDMALEAISKERPDGFLALMDLPLLAHLKRIIDFLEKNRLPAIFENRDMVELGGLISYGPSHADVYRRAAIQMDKILKGAKPATLPVEQPIKLELVVNLKTAQQMGLNIPPHVLARADRVIK